MRVNKYRAWNGRSMVTYDIHIVDGQLCTNGNIPIMQFTGLLDKNGKEIYEGDIVERTWEGTVNYEKILVVQWENKIPGEQGVQDTRETARFSLFNMKDDRWGGEDFGASYNIKLKVIGNIYENKELLNDKSN